MTQGERVKMIRKEFNLTMEEFGDRIGNISKSTISNIENGNRNLTHLMLKAICREFNINEEWLLNGTDPMKINLTRSEKITDFAADLLKDEEDSYRRRLIEALADLDEEEWELLEKISEKAAHKKKDQANNA